MEDPVDMAVNQRNVVFENSRWRQMRCGWFANCLVRIASQVDGRAPLGSCTVLYERSDVLQAAMRGPRCRYVDA